MAMLITRLLLVLLFLNPSEGGNDQLSDSMVQTTGLETPDSGSPGLEPFGDGQHTPSQPRKAHGPNPARWRGVSGCAVCEGWHRTMKCDSAKVPAWIVEKCKSNTGRRRAVGLFGRAKVDMIAPKRNKEEWKQGDNEAGPSITLDGQTLLKDEEKLLFLQKIRKTGWTNIVKRLKENNQSISDPDAGTDDSSQQTQIPVRQQSISEPDAGTGDPSHQIQSPAHQSSNISEVTELVEGKQTPNTSRVSESEIKNEANTSQLVIGSVTLVIGSVIMIIGLGSMAVCLLTSFKFLLIIPIAFVLPSCAFLNAYLEYFSFYPKEKIHFKSEAIEQCVFYFCCGLMMLSTFNVCNISLFFHSSKQINLFTQHSWKVLRFRSDVYGMEKINHHIKWIYRIFVCLASTGAAAFPVLRLTYPNKPLLSSTWCFWFIVPMVWVYGVAMIIIKIKNKRFIKTEKWENLLNASLQKCYFEWIAMHYFLWSTMLIAFEMLLTHFLNASLFTTMCVLFGHCVINTFVVFILIRRRRIQKEKNQNNAMALPIYSQAAPLSSGIQTRNDTIINMTPKSAASLCSKYKDLSPESFKALIKKELRSQMDNKTYCDLISIIDEWPKEKVIGLIKLCGKDQCEKKKDDKPQINAKNPKVPMLSLSSNKSDPARKTPSSAAIDFSEFVSQRKLEKWQHRAKNYRLKIPATREENWQYWFFGGDCSTGDIIKDSTSSLRDKSNPSSEFF